MALVRLAVEPALIVDAHEVGDLTIALLDPDQFDDRTSQYRNLVAIANDGLQTWAADLPTTSSRDRYYRVRSWEPLVALSVESFACTIDNATGKIISKEFLK